MLDKLWDDVLAGPQPEEGLAKFRRITVDTNNLNNKEDEGSSSSKYQRSISMPTTPGTPSPTWAARKENVWRSVFHPGSNLNTRSVGAHQYYDKPAQSQVRSPTTYDWLYSDETRSKYA